jgi:hypothetical protein
MLAETLMALAAAGGTTLVGAMATDAWEAARDGVARLFGRAGADRRTVIEGQLAEDADTLAHVGEAEREQVRQELVPVWRRRLARLLEEHPDASVETELRDLVARVQAALPPAQQAWVQNNTAHGGNLFAVQGGNQEINYHGGASDPDRDGPGT